MNGFKSIKLMRKYAACVDCGNELVGDGEGVLLIEDDIFKRSCKCGWSIEVDEDGKPLLDLKVACWATIGPKRVYEIHDRQDRFYGYVDVNKLQKLGHVKRINHTEKTNDFINTPEGKRWVAQNRFFNI